MSNIMLPTLSDTNLGDLIKEINKSETPTLLVFSCGYEERSLTQYLELKEHIKTAQIDHLCFSFTTYRTSGSREKNEAILADDGVVPVELDPSDWKGAWDTLDSYLKDNDLTDIRIIIDYSSMPRTWYSKMTINLLKAEINPKITFLYSHGEYFATEYPCVGYGQFRHFTGRPNITSARELTVFGLGFDSIRTHGIWTFLDPQLSISIIAKSPKNQEHCHRVRCENPEILSASESVFEVNIDQFNSTLSTLIDISRQYSTYGDIALVPDGPKPLVLAMSIVPLFLGEKGIYCWHVGHIKPDLYEPIDIKSSGEFFGFTIS